jgi:hypothetical protein
MQFMKCTFNNHIETESTKLASPLQIGREEGGREPKCPTKRRRLEHTNSRNASRVRKREMETSPACGSVLGPDLATVRFDECLGDGES